MFYDPVFEAYCGKPLAPGLWTGRPHSRYDAPGRYYRAAGRQQAARSVVASGLAPGSGTYAKTLRLTAHNSATESENRIHSDEVAHQYGFRGGLVPGVVQVRLFKPVFGGDELAILREANLVTANRQDELCAQLTIGGFEHELDPMQKPDTLKLGTGNDLITKIKMSATLLALTLFCVCLQAQIAQGIAASPDGAAAIVNETSLLPMGQR